MLQGVEMKERYWTNLVTSLRYGQCVLVLGPRVPATLAATTESSPAAGDLSYTEELTRHLTSELEDDSRCGPHAGSGSPAV